VSCCKYCNNFELIPFRRASHRDIGVCCSDAANASGVHIVKQSTTACPEFYERRLALYDAEQARKEKACRNI
jgi:hypothetical protein